MEGPNISFVVWPDGKVSDRSLTIGGERLARERHIRTWLPTEWFGDVSSYPIDTLWRGMESKGFRSYTITIDKDGRPVLRDEP